MKKKQASFLPQVSVFKLDLQQSIVPSRLLGRTQLSSNIHTTLKIKAPLK